MKDKRFRVSLVIGAFCILCGLACLGALMYMRSSKGIERKQNKCAHETWVNGECAYCGYRCPHDEWNEGICAVCGFLCGHDWDDSICSICGIKCGHPSFLEGVCEICGFKCPNHHYENGVCRSCGSSCLHEWRNGICEKCQMVCTHESHDKDTRKCPVCGSLVCHRYYNGVCECGAKPEIYDSWLPPEYYEPCEHQGIVEQVTYSQKLLAYGGFEVQKIMNVYLPYGYNENQQYDVLVMIHGGWDDENSWVTNEYDDYGFKIVMKNIYDNMMDRKLCEPVIIVCPTTYNEEDFQMDSGYDGFAQEIRETILPYVADHYSTYAASGGIQDLLEARTHFAIGGESNGSLYTLHSGMLRNFDLFGRFICLSGNNLAPEEIDYFLNSRKQDLPFEFFFAGAGTLEEYRNYIVDEYQMLLNKVEDLKEGENTWFFEIQGYHEFTVWATQIFIALQMLF